MPKYKEIALNILKKISNDSYHDKLPPESKLMEEYHVSRNTLRKAINILNEQGIIIRVQGSGSYISTPIKKNDLMMNLSNKLGFKSLGFKNLVNQVLCFKETSANLELTNFLKCSINAELYEIQRLRYSDNKALCLEHTYYLKKYVPYLSEEICKNSIFEFIKKHYDIKTESSEEFLTLHNVSSSEAKLANVKENDVFIELTEINMLKNNVPFNYSKTIYFDKNISFYNYVNNKI